MRKYVFALVAALFAVAPAVAESAVLKFGAWNITNLHHESGVALRSGAKPRDDIDFDRLKEFAASLDLDIVALQEIGSPTALARIFPPDEYHLVISGDYVVGAEAAADRDIYNAFAIRKSAFPTVPLIEDVEALRLLHQEVDRQGKPSDRPVRAGLVLHLALGQQPVELLNVHLKSGCNAASLDPVLDTRTDGQINSNRYACRTLLAQAALLENWIEQREQLGLQVVILGDFNRQMNRETGTDHFWQMIEDGGPNGIQLVRAPTTPNTVCWPEPHSEFFATNIDFITFDARLGVAIDAAKIHKIGIPFETDPRYAGEDNQRLSDHCPTVGELAVP